MLTYADLEQPQAQQQRGSVRMRQSARSIRQHASAAYVSIRQHTSAYVSQKRSSSVTASSCASPRAAYVSMRLQHTSAYVSIRQHTSAKSAAAAWQRPHAPVRAQHSSFIRQHTSAYVSIRQHTSAYISIRQNTPAYASIRQHNTHTCEQHSSLAALPAVSAPCSIR
jgi:hypothetical protein